MNGLDKSRRSCRDSTGAKMDLVDASWDGLIFGISIISPLCTCFLRIDGKVTKVASRVVYPCI